MALSMPVRMPFIWREAVSVPGHIYIRDTCRMYPIRASAGTEDLSDCEYAPEGG